MLRMSAAFGATAFLAACTDDGGSSGGTVATDVDLEEFDVFGSGGTRADAAGASFLDDDILNGAVQFMVGATGASTAEAGEVFETIGRIEDDGTTFDAYYDRWREVSRRLAESADSAASEGRTQTAIAEYLRASEYATQPLFTVLGTTEPGRETTAYRECADLWERAVDQLGSQVVERVEIPYEDTTMPGYFFRAGDGARPTVILNQGDDDQEVDSYGAFGATTALARGHNVLQFEGPGQMSMFFERDIVFRPDWENVITPVVDYLTDRSDVDADRIALVGISFSGLLCGRAAAFEPRLRAVVLNPGATNYIDSWRWPESFVESARKDRDRDTVNAELSGAWDTLDADTHFEIYKRGECLQRSTREAALKGEVPPDLYGLIQEILKYDADEYLPRVQSPTLVLGNAEEQFFTGQAKRAYERITAPKDFFEFNAAQGAAFHCQPMAPQFQNEVVFDWLDARFA